MAEPKKYDAAKINELTAGPDGRDFVYGDHEAFDKDLVLHVTEDAGTWRWGPVKRSIVEVKATGDLFEVRFRSHVEEGFERAFPARQVRRVEKTVIDYVPVEGVPS